jgi:N,N'-diacetyllegionaminate synthase
MPFQRVRLQLASNGVIGVTMGSITIGGREVGEGSPCFITFEAGPTHTGLDSAKALVDVAAASGADAIKFQIFDAERLVADKKQMFSYQTLADRATGALEDVEESLYEILCRRCMEPDAWRALKAYADQKHLAFFATVGFEEDVAFVRDLGCDSIKVGSSDVNHLPLIRTAARTGLVVQIDTGNSTIGEIETAVDAILEEGNDQIIIHQCPSGYPARLPSIHLRMIPTLKLLFGLPVAYSDHTPGWEMDVAALALGANLVEKTITMDRTTRSPEHVFSLEPEEAQSFVRVLRDVETAMGTPRRAMSSDQRLKRTATRRSAFSARAIRQGSVLGPEDIEFRRPGSGISPTDVDALMGTTAARDISANVMIQWRDLEGP